MNLLDMRTVVLSYAISNFICMIVIAILWIQNRKRFNGLGFWLADYALQFVALVLIVLRGVAPDLLSMTGSNAMVIGGTVLLYIGLQRFMGMQGRQYHNYILLAAFVLVHAWFVIIFPSLAVRNILFSLALLLICFQCAGLLLWRSDPEMRTDTSVVGYVFVVFCLISIMRIVVDVAVPVGNDFFKTNIYDTLLLLMYQMLFIILTFSLFLTVNRRLFVDLEQDILVRRETESALRLSEEKFYKAFQSSPDAILISRMRDGRLIEVNDTFCRRTGYSREEALSSSSFDLNLMPDQQDRERIVATLLATAHVRDYEFDIRTKFGTILKANYSGEIINLGDEPHILSVVRDVTEAKLAEIIIRLRLMLWEFSTTHSAIEVMQKALDEIEQLTESRIGFYHLVDEEQSALTLQAWSTRTKAEFCRAEGEGMHYPINKAGVWVDCIRWRRPVIHNDYASLPDRKGMPPGHAEVVRELVVPTMREGRVVSVLGVGNKPSNYEEKDIELVAYVADVVWNIVEQKRDDEEIRRLNSRLEHLSMTDELTGLANRRAFFLIGNEEIKKAQRYKTPLSLMILDIDKFKNINDTYGHDAGDAALQCLARTLQSKSREVDVIARLGGEEFGILLPNTKASDAVMLAERFRSAIEGEECLIPEGRSARITASFGVATYRDEIANLDMLLQKADAAMYQAKNEGRNRVVLHG